jgi:H+/Cl- antiporter ClcA
LAYLNNSIIGAAAGVSSAFHSPLGGVMFALEEAISYYEADIILQTLFTSGLSYITVGLFSKYK